MSHQYEKTNVLITVITYPHPSQRHLELVCTGGITDSFEWVRLYPIDYRYQPEERRFHKYQWIQIDLAERGIGNDNRKESRCPNMDSIKILAPPLPTTAGWQERRRIIDRMPIHTLNELKSLYEKDYTSLGIVRPKRILDLEIEETEHEWKPEWKNALRQMRLFGDQPKKLEKIPYKFSCVFECTDDIKPHRAMIEDWELGVLYLRERDRLQSEVKAAHSVKDKFLNSICGPDRDVRFFMGTVYPYNSWIIGGVFYPPKKHQMELDLSTLNNIEPVK